MRYVQTQPREIALRKPQAPTDIAQYKKIISREGAVDGELEHRLAPARFQIAGVISERCGRAT